MFAWLASNAGTILVLAVLLAVVCAVAASLLRDRKRGKCACGGSCGSCAGCAGCGGRRK